MNYVGNTRTNYFAVTDVSKFYEIMDKCHADDEIEIITDGKGNDVKYGFVCNASIEGFSDENSEYYVCEDCGLDYDLDDEDATEADKTTCPECGSTNISTEFGDFDYDFDGFCEALQSILPDDEAIIITETGHEGLRSLCGYSFVITKNKTGEVDINKESLKLARELLGNPNFGSNNIPLSGEDC